MKARIKNLQVQYKSLNTAVLSIEVSKYTLQYLPDGNRPLMLEINEYKKPRTRNANALMWELCEKLAEKIPGISKEDVYRQSVHSVGICFSTTVPTAQAEDLSNSRGVGWLAERIGQDDDTTSILLYPGSSTYTTEQMARLIDYLMDECKEEGIQLNEDSSPR
mgnify:CR=1 FL=1